MTNSTDDIYRLWEAALAVETRPEDAIALLVDAAALGLAGGDFDPVPIITRLQESFDALMVAKQVYVAQRGRVQ